MMNEGTSDPMDDLDLKLDEILEIPFFCPLCRNTPLSVIEWGPESFAEGTIMMSCRTCRAEVHYYVDLEETEKALRDRILTVRLEDRRNESNPCQTKPAASQEGSRASDNT